MAFEDKVYGRVEQGMAGADEGRGRETLAFVFLEVDAFVGAMHGHAVDVASLAGAFAYDAGDVFDLVAARLPAVDRAAEVFESLQKEGPDEVRLKTPCLSTLHVLPYLFHLRWIHGLSDQRPLLNQVLQMLPVLR